MRVYESLKIFSFDRQLSIMHSCQFSTSFLNMFKIPVSVGGFIEHVHWDSCTRGLSFDRTCACKLNKTFTQHHPRLTKRMRVEQNFYPTIILIWPCACELNKTFIQLSSSFDRARASWTKLSSNYYPHLTVRMRVELNFHPNIILI